MPTQLTHLHFQSDKILTALSKEDKSLFLSYGQPLKFKKGKLIFYEYGMPTGVFLVQKGRVKIYKTGIYGKDQIFYIYKAGDLFGYHALLANENYEDSCEALEDCELLFVRKKDFEHLLKEIHNLKLLLIQNMSHEFGVLVNTITILAQKTLRERLALYLLVLHERYLDISTGVSKINLPREDLANIVGTARESLGRLLKEFKEDNIIEVEGRGIKIIDFSKLNKVANF